MKSLDDEFLIIRGGLIAYNAFQGRNEYTHGFFIYKELLCHKIYHPKEVLLDHPELCYFDFYNRENDCVENYWDGMRDGDFNENITTIITMKYIPFEFYKNIYFINPLTKYNHIWSLDNNGR